ncbi:MAG: hypothetical protein ACK5YR_19300 [Pirellula sp.]|jgi:hypothetical protein
MFSDSFDHLPPQWRSWRIILSIAALLAIVFIGWFFTKTQILARGRIEDLPAAEKQILSELEQAGIQVRNSRSNYSFGEPPIIVTKVLWNKDIGSYAVTRIELHHDSYIEVLSSLRKLGSLREIAAPLLGANERAVLQQELPDVNVVNW